MKSLISLIAALLFICATSKAIPQVVPAEQLDLAAVVNEALRSHPSLRAAGARLGGAQAAGDAARAESAPRVNGEISLSRFQDSPTLSAGSLGAIPLGGRDQKSASVEVRYPVYTGGRLEAARGQALAVVQASEASLVRQRQQVAMEATTAFYGVLKARALAESAESQLNALLSQRNSISRLFDEGVATRLELLRADTAVASAEEAVHRARNGAALALAALANAMGRPSLPSDARLVERKADSRARLAAIWDDDPAQQAYLQRADLRRIEAEIKAAEAGLAAAQSGNKPSVSAFARYNARRPSFQPDTGSWEAGIGLNVSLFDGGLTRALVARARAQLVQVKADRDELRNDIALQVTQAAVSVRSARVRLATAEKGQISADEGARLMQIGYQSGVNTLTDYLATQAEQTRARNDRIAALYDLRAAEAELQFALGGEPEI